MSPDEESTHRVCTLGAVVALFGVFCIFVILITGYWID